MMARLKEQVIRDLDALSPTELIAVQQLVGQMRKARSGNAEGARVAAQRVRAALKDLPGSLSAAVAAGRGERV